MRFIHVADVHLGYQQYGSKERFNDFSRVFLHIIEQAVEQQVDFLLVAGDLFEKRTVDPLAMRVAVEGLRILREAGIPVLAVEGNHERAHYRDQYSWVEFLDALGYLRLLNPRFENGHAILKPYGDAGGAYVDLPNGVRVYGLKYYGASTSKVFSLFADGLAENDHGHVDFTILLAHAGLEGQLPRYSGTLTHNELAPLREYINYLALGHIHKPYAADGWIYNPGSLETWSVEEAAWPERGYYLVDIRPGENPDHQAELIAPPRRPFHRLRLTVDALTEPNAVYDAVRRLIKREDGHIIRDPASVVELTLSGVLPFSRFDLDLDYVEGLLQEAWSPLKVRLQNRTTPAEFEISVDIEASRPELERAIVQELLERDARFRQAADEWTRVALEVKRLALESSPPETVIDTLRRARGELGATAEESALSTSLPLRDVSQSRPKGGA
jgi:DNA repair exonuclease SbcCD nuclease subunit